MITGTIVLTPFPFAELSNIKVRPAVLVFTTNDKYKDLALCAISSVVPSKVGTFEILVQPDDTNKLRVPSTIKVDRIMTLKKENVIAQLGLLSGPQLTEFRTKFKRLVD